ncbi:DnaJ domain-containing protein, partial [Podospora australis]
MSAVTAEQKAAVQRILRCAPLEYYSILGVSKTSSESEIKKAYRKLSLLVHPDKNKHEQAEEAFKMVAEAYGVLGDQEQRAKFDNPEPEPTGRDG